MIFHYRNIILILLTLIGLSCKEAGVDREAPENNPVLTLNDIFHEGNVSNTSFNPFLLGNKFRITHESYSCFHYNSRYINVEENNGGYIVILKDQFSNKAYSPAYLDSDFSFALKDFNNYYSKLLEAKDQNKSKNENSFGTVNKLTIQGGFKTTEIFCDKISELSGINDLINRINLFIAD